MEQPELERQIREACQRGAYAEAMQSIVQGYGPEVLAFVHDRGAQSGDGDDVYADFTETLWRSLPAYRGDCSARTWAYLIARRAISRQRRFARSRRETALPSEFDSEMPCLAEVRSRTAPFVRTEIKSRARELRETLSEEDQQLLLLRLERNLSFRDIARVMSDDDALDDARLTRESARLRKRFQHAKEQLAALLMADGLIELE